MSIPKIIKSISIGAAGLFLAFIAGMTVAPFSDYFSVLGYPACNLLRLASDTKHGITTKEARLVTETEQSRNIAFNTLMLRKSDLDNEIAQHQYVFKEATRECDEANLLSDDEYYEKKEHIGKSRETILMARSQFAKLCKGYLKLETPDYLQKTEEIERIREEILELSGFDPKFDAAVARLNSSDAMPKICKDLSKQN